MMRKTIVCFVCSVLMMTAYGQETMCSVPLDEDSCSYWYYHDEYWDEPVFDDIVIILCRKEGRWHGLFYGSSDLFADAREGYYPGFCVLPMEDIKMWGDSVSFSLNSMGVTFVSRPIGLDCESNEEALAKGYSEWRQPSKYFWKEVTWKGKVLAECLYLKENGAEGTRLPAHHFRAISSSKARRIDRNSLQESQEQWNRAQSPNPQGMNIMEEYMP